MTTVPLVASRLGALFPVSLAKPKLPILRPRMTPDEIGLKSDEIALRLPRTTKALMRRDEIGLKSDEIALRLLQTTEADR